MVAKRPRAAAEEGASSGGSHAREAMKKLRAIQKELDEVSKESWEKILEIRKYYDEKRKPVYTRRNEIIAEIPNFWLTAFLKHPTLENMLTSDEDHQIFGYLESLNVEDLEAPQKGYRITFNFMDNPFFENDKLTKTIEYINETTIKSIGTTINWKAGYNILTRRLYHLNRFFNWFNTPEEEVEHDLVAEIIKNEIWTNPVDYRYFWEDELEELERLDADEARDGDAAGDGDGDEDGGEGEDEDEDEGEDEDEVGDEGEDEDEDEDVDGDVGGNGEDAHGDESDPEFKL